MKKLKHLLIGVLIIFTSSCGNYSKLKPSDVTIEDGYIVKCGNLKKKRIWIPDSLGGQAIHGIGEEAFMDKGLTHLKLSEGLISIGFKAFAKNQLIEVDMPSSVMEVKNLVFSDNPEFKTVNFPDTASIIYIGRKAFSSLSYNEKMDQERMDIAISRMSSGSNYDGPYYVNIDPNIKIDQTYVLPHNSHPDFIDYRDCHGRIYHPGDRVVDHSSAIFANLKQTLSEECVEIKEGVITSYTGFFSTLIVPEEIGGQKVIAIADGAFEDVGLVSITLPATLKRIGNSAFASNLLDTIGLPESLTELGESAFASNNLRSLHIPSSLKTITFESFAHNKLQEVTFEEGLTLIEKDAFCNNHISKLQLPSTLSEIKTGAFETNELASLALPPNVKYIEGHAFSYNKLEEISIPKGVRFNRRAFVNNSINVINGEDTRGLAYEIKKDGSFNYSRLIAYWGDNKVVDFIPESVVEIEMQAFAGMEVEEVVLPPKLKVIEEGTFMQSKLKKIKFPDSLERIGISAFYDVEMEIVVLPKNLKVIEEDAFAGGRLEYVDFNDGLEEIHVVAFANNRLENIELPQSLKFIGEEAFIHNALKSVVIPPKVKSIGYSAFSDNEITKVELPKTLSKLNASVFSNNKITSLKIPEGIKVIGNNAFYENEIAHLELPKSLREIEEGAFASNKLSKLIIGNSVKSIGEMAFQYNQLEHLEIGENVEFIGDEAFWGNSKLKKVVIHNKETGYYHNTFDNGVKIYQKK